ncbi:MAG: FAD-dependent oxidoreductase [Armatimonas sp.]
MKSLSVWNDPLPHRTSYPALADEANAEVIIIGGGITGITAAYLLTKAGIKTIVVEGGQIGSGTTNSSTGNLYATVDNHLSRVKELWGQDVATQVARSRAEAIDNIEQLVQELKIDCDFARCPQYLIATDSAQEDRLNQEKEVLEAAGLGVSWVEAIPLSLPFTKALRIENQAQFHPAKYVEGLAQAAIATKLCRVFENTRVISMDGKQLTTDQGQMRGDHIVLATHTPAGFHRLQTEMAPYREYGLAMKVSGEFPCPPGIFWTLEEPGHSIRRVDTEDGPYLIVIGEKHKTGQQSSDKDYYRLVELFARAHFPVESVAYKWSAQHYRSADELPYIGRSGEYAYVATGFATNGLVYGHIAASTITDMIQGNDNEYRALYDSRRFAPLQSVSSFLLENANVVSQYVKGYLTRAEVESVEKIGPGEGALVEFNGKKHAVSRDESGNWTVLSPVCTHLGCIVQWNSLEKTWDCPCHGSRFCSTGEVIEGPAMTPLEPLEYWAMDPMPTQFFRTEEEAPV